MAFQGVLVVCFAIGLSLIVLAAFNTADIFLLCLVLIGVVNFFGRAMSWREPTALMLLFGVTLGKVTGKLFLKQIQIRYILLFLILVLAFPSWCHLEANGSFRLGQRWMGIWNDPNLYGILMGTGFMLSVGLLAAYHKITENSKFFWLVLIAGMMIAIGLFFSYSRGAWLGTAIGLLYLAKVYGKFKWRYVLPGILVVTTIVLFLWSATSDNAPWYVKRMDFGRPSAQHRVSAWKAGFQIIWDHPFGVGWNKTVEVYEQDYSPPPNGAAAITTNDYLMLGTQLGILALLCFLAYIWLSFKAKTADPTQIACRAGAIVLLVAFWFDGGLFVLPTAAIFWILLELGTARTHPAKLEH